VASRYNLRATQALTRARLTARRLTTQPTAQPPESPYCVLLRRLIALVCWVTFIWWGLLKRLLAAYFPTWCEQHAQSLDRPVVLVGAVVLGLLLLSLGLLPPLMKAVMYVVSAPVWLSIVLAQRMLQTSADVTLGLISRLRRLRASWSFVAAVYIFIPLLSMLTARAGRWRRWLLLLLVAQLASVTVVILMALRLSPALSLVPKTRWLLQLSIRPAENRIFTEQLRQVRSQNTCDTAFGWLDRLDRWFPSSGRNVRSGIPPPPRLLPGHGQVKDRGRPPT
jgi:hypothetical protein